jgi:hypothetical protein
MLAGLIEVNIISRDKEKNKAVLVFEDDIDFNGI